MVRAWVIIGANEGAMGLSRETYCGDWPHHSLPNAVNFNPGQWIEWKIDSILSVILVCVNIPL